MDADFGELSRVWEGALKAPVSGNYRFTVNSRGLTEVYIDGKKAITCQGDKKNINTCGVYVNLNKGNHDIMVKYSQADMFAAMEVRWDLPGFGKELTGIKYLYPKAQ